MLNVDIGIEILLSTSKFLCRRHQCQQQNFDINDKNKHDAQLMGVTKRSRPFFDAVKKVTIDVRKNITKEFLFQTHFDPNMKPRASEIRSRDLYATRHVSTGSAERCEFRVFEDVLWSVRILAGYQCGALWALVTRNMTMI